LHQYAFAVQSFQKALQVAPDDASTHYNLGLAFLGVKDRQASLQQYSILNNLNPPLAAKLYQAVHINQLVIVSPKNRMN
jgi:tetratricopeptide (TPR) repeat protein